MYYCLFCAAQYCEFEDEELRADEGQTLRNRGQTRRNCLAQVIYDLHREIQHCILNVFFIEKLANLLG